MEVFGLGVKIKEEGAATVEAALSKLQKQFTATTKAANDFAKAINKIGASSGPLRQVVNDLDATARTASRLNVAQNNLANSAQNVRDALSQKVVVTGRAAQANANLDASIMRVAKQFAATTLSVTGITLAIRKLIQTSDNMMLLEGRINLVADGMGNLRELQDKLFESAQKTRSAYSDTSELYARIARNSDQLGYSQEQLLRFSELTQMSIRTSGINAIEASRGMIQLSQALASGVLRGDEFRAVMEQMPGTARAIADGLGVPIGKLREMANAGQLTAKLVMDAILSMDATIRADFSQLPVTVGDGFTRIGNAFQKAIVDANDTTGATNALGTALSDLAKNLEGPLTQAFIGVGNAAKALVPIFDGIGKAANFLADNFNAIKAAVITLGSVMAVVFSAAIIAKITAVFAPIMAIGGGIASAIGSFGLLNVAIVAVVGSLLAMKAAIAAIPGVGLALVGLTALFAYLNKQLDDTNDLYEEMDRAGQANMERQIAAIRAGAEAKKRADAEKKAADEAALQRLREMTGKLIDYNAMLPRLQRNTEQLYNIEEALRAELASGNATLERRMEIIKQLASLRPLLQEQADAGLPSLERRTEEFKRYAERVLEYQRVIREGAEAEINRRIQPMVEIAKSPINKADLQKELAAIGQELKDVKIPGLTDSFKEVIETDAIKDTLAQGIAGSIQDGIMSGLEMGMASGSIGEAFRAMGQAIVRSMAQAMVKVAIAAIKLGELLTKVRTFMMNNPALAVVSAIALLAVARSMGGGVSGSTMTAVGGSGGLSYAPMAATPMPTNQLVFGSTSANTAAGMTPRTPMSVTVIGPNDPSAQRAIQELMTKANSRGRIG